MWIVLTRQTEHRHVLNRRERLTREQAIQFYTCNGAWLTFDEHQKGSLQPGKYADLIKIDRDVLKCPVDDIPAIKVPLTMVNGKVVWEAK